MNPGAVLICERVLKTACEGLPLYVLCTYNRFLHCTRKELLAFL